MEEDGKTIEVPRQYKQGVPPDISKWMAGEPIIDEYYRFASDTARTPVRYAPGHVLEFRESEYLALRLFWDICRSAKEALDGKFEPPNPEVADLEAMARSRANTWAQWQKRCLTAEILALNLKQDQEELKKKIQQQQQLIEHLQARILDAKEGRRL